MATPQRNYPSTPPPRKPQLENLQKGGVEREVSGGWRFGFWWIWLLLIPAIWYGGWGWGGHGGWWFHHRTPVETTNDAVTTGQGLEALSATNKQQYVGQGFQIRNVPVERAAGPHALWIGSRFNSTPMLVVLPANGTGSASLTSANAIAQGEWLDVNGQVIAAPNAAQAKQQWNLTDADVSRLENEGAYVQATGVQRAPH